jgi:peptidoglycan hydrolase CwlO-like protein
MEMLETILGILVAVGVIIGYLKSTLTATIHAIVDKMFAEQKATVDKLFAEQRLSFDRQTQTLEQLDKTITKIDAVVDKISEHQHDMDKELAMLGKDVRALHRRVDDHEERFTTFCQFCSNEHKGDMPADVFNLVSYGRNRRGDDE